MPSRAKNNNNNNNNNDEEYDDDRVVEPKEVDVLCGRGGMSNHHPGNEWYRRLIRSNRPLYRACPKHTKLLVSKAIVQAVEQQEGRFLERSRKNGFWYPVPYKRAVDKTSQGLRERDREGEASGGGGKSGGDTAQGYGSDGNTFVPDALLGNSNAKPNLVDLADVAIAHASRAQAMEEAAALNHQGAPPTAARVKRPSIPRSSNMASTTTMNNYNPATTSRAAAAAAAVVTAGTNQPQQQQQRPSWPSIAPPPPHASAASGAALAASLPSRQSGVDPAAAMAAAAEDDMVPLPPTLEQRQSSIFRLFQKAKLLPGSSTALNSELWSSQSPSSTTSPLGGVPPAVTNDSSSGESPAGGMNNFNKGGVRPLNGPGGPMMNNGLSPNNINISPRQFPPGMDPAALMSGGAAAGSGGDRANSLYANNPAAAQALYEYATSQQFPPGTSSSDVGPRGSLPPPHLAAGLSVLVRDGSVPNGGGGGGGGSPYGPNGGPNNNNGGEAAPALTRLTSQVSDWLYSFWPVASRADSVAGQQLPGGPSGPGGSPMRTKMGQHLQQQQAQLMQQQQQQAQAQRLGQTQKRPDPLGADGDSDDEGKGPPLPSRNGSIRNVQVENAAIPPTATERKSTGPYSDMMKSDSEVNTNGTTPHLTAREEKERDREARKRFAQAPPIVTFPPPKPAGPVHINTIPPMQKGSSREMAHYSQQQQQEQQQRRSSDPYGQQQRLYSQEPPRKRNKRKSSSNMPQLPYDHQRQAIMVTNVPPPGSNIMLGSAPSVNGAVALGGAAASMSNVGRGGMGADAIGRATASNSNDSNMDAVAPPTELEQSVSATLLKLAGSPKSLFSGMTRFFETGETSIGAPLRAPPPGAAQQSEAYYVQAMADTAGRRGSNSSAAAACPPPPPQMMTGAASAGGPGYGAPPSDNDFRRGNVGGPSLLGIKRSSGDLLDD